MKLKFYKEEGNDYVKIVTQDGDELEFDYIEMIRYIFNDKKIEEAIKLGNVEGLKLLLEIEKEAKIKNVGDYSWAYSIALKYNFNLSNKKE